MSVQDLKDTLKKIEAQANTFAEQLGGFLDANEADLREALKALEGTSSGTDATVSGALKAASAAIDDAKRAMDDAAQAASNYAGRI
ncbi:hypothetical protein [Microbacterium memoriense]|uniref:Uncharacterized protein n=1 Tax=Microbacterium memoriense TaxID=2978350 RepID=A0ABT2PDD8_9MICO|nr:hypothetical protein [Microbacterium memoriense]MCT9002615.1 hypothetical protein [Microbacterium memoriense]